MSSTSNARPHAKTLEAHRVFRTSEVDAAVGATVQLLGGAHRLVMLESDRNFDAEMRAVPLSEDLLFFYCRYGGHVRLEVPELPFTLLQTPIHGRSMIRAEGRSLTQTARYGSLVSQGQEMSLRFRPETEGLGTAVRAEALRMALEAHLGEPVHRPLRFEGIASDLEAPGPSFYHQHVRALVSQIDSNSPVFASKLARTQMVDHLISQLLFSHRHNYSERLAKNVRTPAPAHVRRVERYIEAHAGDAIRLADLVHVSGVSARSLQDGFRRFRSTTPMKYLRDVRLRRVHAQLSAAEPGEATVFEIALRWGFGSPGRFAHEYAARFGEKPSQTLRRRKR